MAEAVSEAKSVEGRLETLEKRFEELRAQVLGMKPREKDWRRTVGTFPRDEIALEAEQLGREWRERSNEEA